jgi:RND family efflux transporter MFP subunit
VHKGQLLAALDLREIDAMLDKAKIGVDKAERDQARIRRLAADSVATLAQLQDATSALDAARADYQSARVNREYASIVAPEDGVVLLRSATAGSNIGAGSTVLLLGGGARGRVLHVGLPDRDALRIKLGDAATVQFTALANRAFHGAVTLRGQSSDARTGTYAVEVTLTDAGELPAGLIGRVEIAVRSSARAAMVPVDALLEADADSATVYTLNTDPQPIATSHRVRIAQLVGDRAAVTGLDNDARVITRGAPYVMNGAKVRVVATPSTAATVSQATTP